MALYPVRSDTRELNVAQITFTTNGGSDPAYVDSGNIVSSIVGPTTVGTAGKYTITLKNTHAVVVGVANMDGNDEFFATVDATGSLALSVLTKQIDIAGGSVAGANTTGRTVSVLVHLQR